jgi:hypothetical protein
VAAAERQTVRKLEIRHHDHRRAAGGSGHDAALRWNRDQQHPARIQRQPSRAAEVLGEDLDPETGGQRDGARLAGAERHDEEREDDPVRSGHQRSSTTPAAHP